LTRPGQTGQVEPFMHVDIDEVAALGDYRLREKWFEWLDDHPLASHMLRIAFHTDRLFYSRIMIELWADAIVGKRRLDLVPNTRQAWESPWARVLAPMNGCGTA
jgi:hypothetical protein